VFDREGRNISDEDLQNFIKAAQAIENNPETNEAASWRKDTKKHGGGFLGGLMGLLENPGYAPQFVASSLATMASSLFDSEEVAGATAAGAAGGAVVGKGAGALAGSVGGPVGTFLGYIAGAGAGAVGGGMAGLVGAMETGLTLTDLLRDELGGKEFNQENIRALLNDKDVMDRVTSRSLARGLTIGAIEGLTFGLSRGVGGKILASAATKGAIGLSKAGLKTGAKVAFDNPTAPLVAADASILPPTPLDNPKVKPSIAPIVSPLAKDLDVTLSITSLSFNKALMFS
jgi:hypothetical protein